MMSFLKVFDVKNSKKRKKKPVCLPKRKRAGGKEFLFSSLK